MNSSKDSTEKENAVLNLTASNIACKLDSKREGELKMEQVKKSKESGNLVTISVIAVT